MEKMTRRYLIIASLLASAALAPNSFARQEVLRGSVLVEGRYLPDIIRQDRVNTLPKRVSFSMPAEALTYELNSVDLDYSPYFFNLPALGLSDVRSLPDTRGYLRVDAGSWLDANVSAGYRMIDEDKTVLGVSLQHNSTSLWKPFHDYDTKQKIYDQTIGVYGSHDFGSGRLGASLDYRLGYFNYYGFRSPFELPENSKAPSQTLNDVRFKASWASPRQNSFRWDANLGLRYFGFRDLLIPGGDRLVSYKGQRETHFSLGGKIEYITDEGSSFVLGLKNDALSYANPQGLPLKVDGYDNLALTPGYRFNRDLLNINIGARVDFSFGAGPENDRFSAIHIAPDVRLDYRTGGLGVYLHAVGGNTLNTLARQNADDYYSLPALTSTNPEYSPIDARFGVNVGPFSGFSAGMSFGYKYVRHSYLGGWYTYFLNNPSLFNAFYSISPSQLSEGTSMDIHGWNAELFLAYDEGDFFDGEIRASYQPQNGKDGYTNGVDRPRWILGAVANVHPVEPLTLTLRYDYRGVRNVWRKDFAPYPDGVTVNGASGEWQLVRQRLADITDLGFEAAWQFSPTFSVKAGLSNILGCKTDWLPSLPTQGMVIRGGLQILF